MKLVSPRIFTEPFFSNITFSNFQNYNKTLIQCHDKNLDIFLQLQFQFVNKNNTTI